MEVTTILDLVREIELFERLGALAQANGARMRLAGVVLDVGEPARSVSRNDTPMARIQRGRYELTMREREVLELLAMGRSDGEIAEALFISKKTAAVHVSNIKGKLCADSRVAIVTIAMRRGLVPTPALEARSGP